MKRRDKISHSGPACIHVSDRLMWLCLLVLKGFVTWKEAVDRRLSLLVNTHSDGHSRSDTSMNTDEFDERNIATIGPWQWEREKDYHNEVSAPFQVIVLDERVWLNMFKSSGYARIYLSHFFPTRYLCSNSFQSKIYFPPILFPYQLTNSTFTYTK